MAAGVRLQQRIALGHYATFVGVGVLLIRRIRITKRILVALGVIPIVIYGWIVVFPPRWHRTTS